MKKVLAIAPYPYLPYFSGGQKFIAGFYEHLARVTDLTVISTLKNDVSLATGYRLLPILKNSFSRYYDMNLLRTISEEVRAGSYDAIIWEHPYFWWLADRIKKKTGIKTILHAHNIEYQRFRSTGRWWWPVLRNYEKRFFRKADLVLFITPVDRDFAIREWKVDPGKCLEVPFGINISSFPHDRALSMEIIRGRHGISGQEKILLFNGMLNYKPNLDALKVIIEQVNPILQNTPGFDYRILVCGKGLPAEWKGLEDYRLKNIIYAGFVEDISVYFKSADVFLNPVVSGGGIKTKMVEAIAYGATVVSAKSGATGILPEICGKKLVVVEDGAWNDFATAVVQVSRENEMTPAAYYEYYNWEKIIGRIEESI